MLVDHQAKRMPVRARHLRKVLSLASPEGRLVEASMVMVIVMVIVMMMVVAVLLLL
jgi:hypothetical protein